MKTGTLKRAAVQMVDIQSEKDVNSLGSKGIGMAIPVHTCSLINTKYREHLQRIKIIILLHNWHKVLDFFFFF